MILPQVIALLAAATLPGPAFEPRECAHPPPPRAVCGVVKVPENREAPARRTLELNVVVLKSAMEPRLPPLFDIDGGPGLPSTKNAGFYATNDVSKSRDVVMVDQRGTGRSNPLLCPGLQTGPTEPMLPPPRVRACREALSKRADLRFYGTRHAVSDLEAVRQALGYSQIDLFGLSYGTTVALRYMRRYPANVRSAILMGTSPPDFKPPQYHAPSAARALEMVLRGCERDAACSQAFPRLRQDLWTARKRLRARGSQISDELLMERLRALMYSPESRARLPLLVHRAAAGDIAELLAKKVETGAPMIADGMFLAVTCGESFALMDDAAAAAKARSTPFGDYRIRRQKAACADWPKVKLDADHLELPTETSASVLLVSGEIDPVTPPAWADRVAAALPRARHIVVPGGGHILDGLKGVETCLDPIMIAFLDHADFGRLATSCVERMTGPGFVLK
jgi:pimeloyl-ACP methyl ester carboxylesterase